MQDYRSSRVNIVEYKRSLPSSDSSSLPATKCERAQTHTHTHTQIDSKRKSNLRQGAHTLLFTLQTYDIQIHGQTEKRRGSCCAGTQGEEAKAAISEIGTRADYSDGPGAASKDVYCVCRVYCPHPPPFSPPPHPFSPSLPFLFISLAGSSL